tara:strand:- start:5 stop:262 length:258 start_codon:yes stop_codon:yes gene_type:complete
MLSIAASVVETIVIKTSVFAANQLFNIAWYSTSSLYNWYNPTLSESERLQIEVNILRGEINQLKDEQYSNIINKIIILDDSGNEI